MLWGDTKQKTDRLPIDPEEVSGAPLSPMEAIGVGVILSIVLFFVLGYVYLGLTTGQW